MTAYLDPLKKKSPAPKWKQHGEVPENNRTWNTCSHLKISECKHGKRPRKGYILKWFFPLLMILCFMPVPLNKRGLFGWKTRGWEKSLGTEDEKQSGFWGAPHRKNSNYGGLGVRHLSGACRVFSGRFTMCASSVLTDISSSARWQWRCLSRGCH